MTSLSTSRQTPVAEVFCPMSSEKSVKIDRNPQQHAAVVDGQTNYAVCPPPEGLQKNGFCHVSSDIESFFYRQVASAGFSRSQWFLLALAADQTPSFHHAPTIRPEKYVIPPSSHSSVVFVLCRARPDAGAAAPLRDESKGDGTLPGWQSCVQDASPSSSRRRRLPQQSVRRRVPGAYFWSSGSPRSLRSIW